jgi:hypothetical protein
VYELLHDERRNVLLTRLSGIYTEDDLALRDQQVARFVARRGLARGLMDYTGVTHVDIPMDTIVRRAHAPPLLPGQTRVVVASNEPAYSLNRVIIAHQYFSRKVEPLMVGSLQDAYWALGSAQFDFAPVVDDEQVLRDRVALQTLVLIDEVAREPRPSGLDSLEPREADTSSSVDDKEERSHSAITLADLFNSGLRKARVSDRELFVYCRQCGRPSTLALCSVSIRRKTTYSCPNCNTVLVELSPITSHSPELASYSIGGFDVTTRVDIRCYLAVLPKSSVE